jgi:hypothetical protein
MKEAILGNVKWRWWGGEVPWKGRGGGSDECGVARSGGAGLDVNGGAGVGSVGGEMLMTSVDEVHGRVSRELYHLYSFV